MDLFARNSGSAIQSGFDGSLRLTGPPAPYLRAAGFSFGFITASAGNSWMFENRIPHVLDGDYATTVVFRPATMVNVFLSRRTRAVDPEAEIDRLLRGHRPGAGLPALHGLGGGQPVAGQFADPRPGSCPAEVLQGFADLPEWLRSNRITIFRTLPTTFRNFMASLPPDEAGTRIGARPASVLMTLACVVFGVFPV
jgi:hypothetical protein